AVSHRTERAVPPILTGRYPRKDVRPILAEYPNNRCTLLLATHRYELTVFEPYTRLFPRGAGEAVPPRSVSEQMRSLLGPLPFVYINQLFPSDLPVILPDTPREWFGVKAAPQDIH